MDLSDPTAFARMYDEHARGVYGAAMRILGDPAQAQDVAQDVFLRVWRNPQNFDRAAASSASTCASWPAAGRSTCGARARPPAAPATASRSSSPRRGAALDERPSALAERERSARAVRDALGALPGAQREAVVLAYWGGLTADQIARRSGVPLGTAKSRIRLGLAKLRPRSRTPWRRPRPPPSAARSRGGHRLGSRAACRRPGATSTAALRRLLTAARTGLAPGDWFDAHTHIGHNDPDGFEADPEEILAGLDDAGHQRALIFPMHEPGGYRAANDARARRVRGSGGRLAALARVEPERRGRGRRGPPLPRRGRARVQAAPALGRLHAPAPGGRARSSRSPHERAARRSSSTRAAGIPHLGEAVVDLARRYPGARLILAHAGISELGWIAPRAAELPNLFFDTAWWQVADLLALYATSRRARSSTRATCPTAAALFPRSLPALRRRGRARRRRAARRSRAVRSSASSRARSRSTSGPPRGPGRSGARDVGFERVVTYLASRCQMAFRGPTPPSRSRSRAWPADLRTDALAALPRSATRSLSSRSRRVSARPEDPPPSRPGRVWRWCWRARRRVGVPASGRVSRVTEALRARATLPNSSSYRRVARRPARGRAGDPLAGERRTGAARRPGRIGLRGP